MSPIQTFVVDWTETTCVIVTVPDTWTPQEIDKLVTELKSKPSAIVICGTDVKFEWSDKK
ncbi:MAG: hypothetical protein E4G98_06690 [Promethearchaeota archaeon]|nr:MAG: hypothetical protein E4G98_06690 [Candidatus Lokiarchaeota archaeon]